MANTYLTRTQGTPTNNKIFTVSCWFKASQVANEMKLIYSDDNSTNNYTYIHFSDGSGRIRFQNRNGGSNNTELIWENYIRDFSAFYHLVIAVDSTQATASDRVKFYLNGVQQTTLDGSANTFPPQNQSFTLNSSGYGVDIGANGYNNNAYFNGLMSYFAFVDGTAYDQSYFGEVDSSSGIWKIKTSPSVTYGNNGFYLKMDTSSPGSDTSGNSNTFTVSGIPTLTQDNASNNFATLNTLTYQAASQSNSGTIQAYDGNTTWKSQGSNQWGTIFSTIAPSTGKWYSEVKVGAVGGGAIVGVVDVADARANSATEWYIGQSSTGQGYQNNGSASNGGASYGATYTTGDIIGCAMDLDNSKIYWSKNGTFQNSGVPTSGATGTGALTLTANTNYAFAVTGYNTTTMNCNFGNGFFGTTAVASSNADAAGHGLMEYPVPTGYYTLNTKNLNTYG